MCRINKIVDNICEEVTKSLKYFPHFGYVKGYVNEDIVGFELYLADTKDYIYCTKQYTAKYVEETVTDVIICDLVQIWDEEDNDETISFFHSIIDNGLKYGWD